MKKDCGVHSWFYPLPVLIIGSYDENGTPDAMNAAWGGLYDSDKVVLCLSAGHKTTTNIKARKAFTVSFADAAHVVEADYVGLVCNWVILVTTLYSGVEYFIVNRDVLKSESL